MICGGRAMRQLSLAGLRPSSDHAAVSRRGEQGAICGCLTLIDLRNLIGRVFHRFLPALLKSHKEPGAKMKW